MSVSCPASEKEGEVEAGQGWVGGGLSALTAPATDLIHPGQKGRNSIKINFWHLVTEGFVTSSEGIRDSAEL